MKKVQIRNFDGVILELPINEVDHIKVYKYFEVEEYDTDDIKVVKFFDKIPKSHRLLDVYHYSSELRKGTTYFFDADRVTVTFC